MLIDTILTQTIDRIQEADGGITIDVTNGQEPSDGFVVAIAPERSITLDVEDAREEDIETFLINNDDVLSEDGAHLGAWHDPATGIVHLDISKVESDREVALEIAEAADEIAIFDLSTFESVTV